MQNQSIGDFSKFPVGQKRSIGPGDHKVFWSGMGKKNKIYFVIILFSLISIAIFLISLLGKGESKGSSIIEYAPPAGYPLAPGEKYAPPFP